MIFFSNSISCGIISAIVCSRANVVSTITRVEGLAMSWPRISPLDGGERRIRVSIGGVGEGEA